MAQLEHTLRAIERLRQGLTHHDEFGALPDDAPVMLLSASDVLFELPHNDGQFSLGDLRDILAFFDQGK